MPIIRTVCIDLVAANEKHLEALVKYAEEIADLADEAMVAQEQGDNIPSGIKYSGIFVVDPENPEAVDDEPEVVENVEIIPPEGKK